MSDAPILQATHVVDDYAGADDFAKKHTPLIEVTGDGPTKMVSVQVGKDVPHPNEPGHYIAWIELYADGNAIARFDLSPVATNPGVGIWVTLDPGTTLEAVEYCNLHGLFSYAVQV
jgi:superoxide reductase